MTAPKPNAELAYRVLDQIDAHPETWNQGIWDCGTAACFAGWAVRLSGGTSAKNDSLDTIVVDGPAGIIGMEVPDAAEHLLGDICRNGDDEDLFDGSNTREDLGRLVEEIFGPRPAQLPPGEWQVCPTCGDPLTTGCRPADGVCVVDDDVPPNAGSAS